MKKIILYICVLAFMGSCEKFLDVKPKGKAILTGFEQYNGLLNNQFLEGLQNLKFTATTDPASGNLSYSFSILGEVEAPFYMSDDVVANASTFQNLTLIEQKMYKWSDDVYLPSDNAAEWNAMYIQNYVYNAIIEGVMKVSDATESGKKEVLAEARVNRAYVHYLAAQLFSKPYDSSSAAADPGIPIVTKASTNQDNFTRASVQNTYDFITGEIKAAIPDLNEATTNRNRVSRLSAYSILGEVYFNMGRYDSALIALNNAFSLLSKSTIPIALYDYNQEVSNWYIPFMSNFGLYNHPNPFDSQESIYVKQTAAPVYSAFASSMVLNPKVWALFGADDIRKLIYSDKGLFSSSLQLPGYQRAGPLTVNFGPVLPNLYLMKAECEARANKLSEAATDLTTLRKNRMPAASAEISYSSQEDLVNQILNERLREFAATGRRWLDMRRLYNDQQYNNVDKSRKVDGQSYTLSADRLALKIPPMIINYNPAMRNNP